MATYTTNYGLHQWVPEDDFLRTDFNTDFQKIDSAIKTTEEGLRSGYQGEVSRLEAALASTTQSLRTEFNGNLDSVNSSLAAIRSLAEGKCSVVTGSYAGDGSLVGYVTDVPFRDVILGFQPKTVLVIMPNFQIGGNYWNSWNTVTLIPGVLIEGTNGNYHTKAQITSNGFQVNNCMNVGTTTYYYLALK